MGSSLERRPQSVVIPRVDRLVLSGITGSLNSEQGCLQQREKIPQDIQLSDYLNDVVKVLRPLGVDPVEFLEGAADMRAVLEKIMPLRKLDSKTVGALGKMSLADMINPEKYENPDLMDFVKAQRTDSPYGFDSRAMGMMTMYAVVHTQLAREASFSHSQGLLGLLHRVRPDHLNDKGF